MVHIIGVTGGIGSGKSTAVDILSSLGAFPIRLDDVAKEVMDNSDKIKQELVGTFGEQAVVNGNIDRKYIGDIVYSNRLLLNILNEIVHPCVYVKADRLIRDAIVAGHKNIVLESPLRLTPFFEQYYKGNLVVRPQIWYVYASRLQRMIRVAERNKFLPSKIAGIMDAQPTEEDYMDEAVKIIINDDDQNILKHRVIHCAMVGGICEES